ncbi:hypothetical protein Pfo_003205 [Paulownia fortunei]|nr:hypothetical protein Pfo_003205 [Paulownia fortunei]
MASYDNLMTEQPWPFRQAFADTWISDVFTKETETITKALQNSFSGTSSHGDVYSAEMVESLFAKPDITPVQTPTVSGGSENEALVSKQRRSVPPSGRVAKRKSRVSKRAATTTFITADPANFRQMVQQVTGVRFAGLNEQLPVASLLKPEPHRAVNQGGGLPTLDTSAFFLDASASSLVPQPSVVVADGGAAAAEHFFDSFCSFPTLESWKAM